MAGKNYHKVLGVSEDASAEQIRRAYRKLAMRFHPDRNDDPGAEEKFKEVREAYAVLSGKEKPPKPVRNPAPDVVFRSQPPPMDYEQAEWIYRVRRAWHDMESGQHNNAYR